MSGDLRARSHPAKFPTYEKELKKLKKSLENLKTGVVEHSLISALGKQSQVDVWLWGQSGLKSKFKDSQIYAVKDKELLNMQLNKEAIFQPQ